MKMKLLFTGIFSILLCNIALAQRQNYVGIYSVSGSVDLSLNAHEAYLKSIEEFNTLGTDDLIILKTDSFRYIHSLSKIVDEYTPGHNVATINTEELSGTWKLANNELTFLYADGREKVYHVNFDDSRLSEIIIDERHFKR